MLVFGLVLAFSAIKGASIKTMKYEEAPPSASRRIERLNEDFRVAFNEAAKEQRKMAPWYAMVGLLIAGGGYFCFVP